MSMIRGRRYNRVKKAVGEHKGNQHTKTERAQSDPLPKTTERLAKQHGVSPATIKRDGAAAALIDKHPEKAQRSKR